MMSSNRKIGNSFEKDLYQSLAAYGFWVHNLAQNSQGQPFDVLAARNGVSYPIDCKVCSQNIFKTDRIEENQFSAMSLWHETGNGHGWFALRLTNGSVYMIPFLDMAARMLVKATLDANEIRTFGWPLREWVIQCK